MSARSEDRLGDVDYAVPNYDEPEDQSALLDCSQGFELVLRESAPLRVPGVTS